MTSPPFSSTLKSIKRDAVLQVTTKRGDKSIFWISDSIGKLNIKKYGEPRWHDAAIGGSLLVKKKNGKGSVEVLTNGNDVFYFLSVFGVLSLFNGMATVKYKRRQKMTRPIVFLTAATVIIKTVSFSAQTALVAHIC